MAEYNITDTFEGQEDPFADWRKRNRKRLEQEAADGKEQEGQERNADQTAQ